ncbi:hypothetical protein PPTG_24579 [Phytophthora nicotianae INRA-310]|uniref:Uncharacterized protein n=1 Tax=Phytophthora nicotianae (strain INRA-310) TaxID=761204 RepID=W2PEJ3_PHYN3|nr:hypothetical protein PPTG_24579 [Phytophthora nicotianae INRA-310]ETM98628.1 hypothetical protein PPTG_24579 [Phytophthora nicotianae INRA-310]
MMQLGRITNCTISKGLTDIFVCIFTVVAQLGFSRESSQTCAMIRKKKGTLNAPEVKPLHCP